MSRILTVVSLVLCAGAAMARDNIVIGATLPLTGKEAEAGNLYKDGYELAFAQANAKGGVLVGDHRVPVSLQLLDDTSDPATSARLLERLIEHDKADFLLGSYTSPIGMKQSEVAEKNKVPYVNGGSSAAEMYQRGFRYTFGLLAPTNLIGETEIRWAYEAQAAGRLPRPARVAIVWENTPHGRDYRRGVLEFIAKSSREHAFDVVFNESFEYGKNNDFAPLLAKVKAVNADVFLADVHLADYLRMHEQYLAAGLCHKVASYGTRGPEKQAREKFGAEKVAYLLSAAWWNAQLGSKGLTKEFVDAFNARYHRVPEWYEALAYESARTMFNAIERAGSKDREAVRGALASMKMESILPGGTLSFPEQYGQQAHYLFVVQQNMPDGESPIVYPPIAATREGIAANPNCAN